MKSKHCQMIVAETSHLALEKSHGTLINEHYVTNNIPDNKITGLIALLNSHGLKDVSFEKINLPYEDDNNNRCDFSLSVLINGPLIWFASVTIYDAESNTPGQTSIFIPECSTSLSNDYPILKGDASEAIIEHMKMDAPHIIPVTLLTKYLGYALNSYNIKHYADTLFAADGSIQLDNLRILQGLINGHSSTFTGPEDKQTEMAHCYELTQLLATLAQIKINTENSLFFNDIFDLIGDGIKHYSVDKYYKIKQNNSIVSQRNSHQSLTFREVNEILHGPELFPDDNYELQYARLTLLLSAYPAYLPLRTEIAKFQQKINENYLNLNRTIGLSKTSLCKDLKILGDILLNPSTENFKKYAYRIHTNEKASNNRMLGAQILTSSMFASLAVAAGISLIVPFALLPALATFGIFATSTGGAILGVKTAKERALYTSELQDLEHTLIPVNPQKWALSELKPVLAAKKCNATCQNEIKMLMSLYMEIENCENIDKLCNSLATNIFILNETDLETACKLKTIRSQVRKSCYPDLNSKADISGIFGNLLDCTIVKKTMSWAKLEVQKIEENIDFSRGHVTESMEKYQFKCRDKMAFILNLNKGIKQAIDELLIRKTNDPVRDNVLARLLINISDLTNNKELLTHLDDAIFALFDNSKNSIIGKDLLILRNELIACKEISPLISEYSFK